MYIADRLLDTFSCRFLDRSQSLFLFIPQDSHNQAHSSLPRGLVAFEKDANPSPCFMVCLTFATFLRGLLSRCGDRQCMIKTPTLPPSG